MKEIHKSIRSLINDLITVAIVFGTVGIALKFITFFDQWVYFPWWPNICDSIFLIFAIVYLALRAKTRKSTSFFGVYS